MKTHLNIRSTLSHCRVITLHPAWRIRTAVVYIDASGSHLIASIPLESVPPWSQYIITLRLCPSSAGQCSAAVLEISVVGTF